MARAKSVVCSCEVCVSMCRRFPCRPLPSEVEKMPPYIRALLMVQSEGAGMNGVPHLQAPARGYEGQEAPDMWVMFGMIGNPKTCAFLTKDGKCELHGVCKPYEGRVAYHDDHHDALPTLKRAWKSKRGRKVLEDWKTMKKIKLLAVPDSPEPYWKVVRADDPTDAVMTGLSRAHAERWADSTAGEEE